MYSARTLQSLYIHKLTMDYKDGVQKAYFEEEV